MNDDTEKFLEDLHTLGKQASSALSHLHNSRPGDKQRAKNVLVDMKSSGLTTDFDFIYPHLDENGETDEWRSEMSEYYSPLAVRLRDLITTEIAEAELRGELRAQARLRDALGIIPNEIAEGE